MKAHGIFSTIVAAAVIILTPAILKADWTYDSGAGTITDSTWTLKVSVGDNNTLTVTGVNTPPGSASALDLSTAVTDGSTAYTIVSIGNSAFQSCAVLSDVTLPNSVTSIGANAFRSCTALTNAVLSDTLALIDGNAFNGDSALVTVTPFLPDTLTSLPGYNQFNECTSLTGDLRLSNQNLVSVNNYSFFKTAITSVDMSGSGIKTISGERTFQECLSLTNVVLSSCLESICSDAFHGDTALVSVTPFLPDTLTSLPGDDQFTECTSLTGDLRLSNQDLKEINTRAFHKTAITSVDMSGSGIKIISGERAFQECLSLTNVVLSSCLESIGSDAFHGDTALVTVTPFLPDTLTSLPVDDHFYNCTSLTGDLRLSNQDLKVINGRTFYGTKITSVDMSGSGIKTIASEVFSGCSILTNAVMSEVLSTVGGSAFSGAVSLTNFYFTGEPLASFSSSCFNNIPQYTTRVFVPRFNSSWEKFAADNVTSPLTADESNTFKAAHPGESLPVGIWGISSTKLWYSDKPYEGTDAFYICGEPVPAGEVSPAYGMITLDNGASTNCTAPANAVFEGKYYVCTGSVTEVETSDHVWETPEYDSGLNRSVTKASDQQQRLTWLWERKGYFIDTTNYYGEGSVTFDPVSQFSNNCYADGTEVTLTAVPAEGWYFRRWDGDIPEADATNATVTVTVDGPKSCRPVFTHGWIYDSVSNTITDGNWTLKVTAGDNNTLTITSMTSVTNQSVLDLSTQIKSENDVDSYTIVSIGSRVFYEKATLLVYVYLPETLTSIADRAFCLCSALKRIEPFLPDSLTSLSGDGNFNSCTALTGDLVITNSGLTSIPSSAFYKTKITSINMGGSGVTSIGGNSFRECTILTNMVLSDTLISIGSDAFRSDAALVNVTPFLPDTFTLFSGDCHFSGCTALIGDLVITNSGLTSIPASAFNGTKITSVDIGTNVTSIGSDAFRSCRFSELVLPNSVTSIGGSTFRSCTVLTNVVLPDTLTSIGSDAFSGDTALVTVTPFLPDSLATLSGDCNFNNCNSLTGDLRLTNPSLTFIPNTAFCNTKITSLYLPYVRQINGGTGAFENSMYLTNVMFGPEPVDLNGDIFWNCNPASYYFPKYAMTSNCIATKRPFRTVYGRNIIYGSRRLDPEGWAAVTTELNDDDRSQPDFPGPKTFGILLSSGTRNWLVDWFSPLEGLNTTVLILE